MVLTSRAAELQDPASTAEEALLVPLGLYLSSRIALLYLFLPVTTFKLP